MASDVSALSSIVANGHQVMPTVPPPPRFIPYGEFSPVRLETQPCRPVPFRRRLRPRLTPSLRSFRAWLRVQAYRFAAGPTGPWLSAVYHARASHRYYGLMRQSDELRPAWALRLALGGLCPHGPFASPSLLFFAILFMHAATSIPLADRVLLMAHPSAMRAFTAPNAARLFQQLLPAGFPGGLVFGTAVFS
jgi:hypothetical protein